MVDKILCRKHFFTPTKFGVEENLPYLKNNIKNLVLEKIFQVGKVVLQDLALEKFFMPITTYMKFDVEKNLPRKII